jgi:hypothetical protein
MIVIIYFFFGKSLAVVTGLGNFSRILGGALGIGM